MKREITMLQLHTYNGCLQTEGSVDRFCSLKMFWRQQCRTQIVLLEILAVPKLDIMHIMSLVFLNFLFSAQVVL